MRQKLQALLFGLLLGIALDVTAFTSYNYFAPGGALSCTGNCTQQSVDLTQSGFVNGPLRTGAGGSGTNSTLTGVLRGGNPYTAAELSGDCTTSGSNAILCTQTNGVAFAPSATTDTTNANNISSGTLAIARGGTNTGSTLTGLIRGGAAYTATELSGDVATSGSNVTTIQTNVVSNTKLAQMTANTIKGNNTGGLANAVDLTVAQTQTLLAVPPAQDVQTFTGSGTWTKPAGVPLTSRVVCAGGGGGGGGGADLASGTGMSGGGGGGSGFIVDLTLVSSSLGATETVSIGPAGTAGTAGSTSAGGNGGAGGNTTFGTWITAFGGGGGQGGASGANTGGGGSGGSTSGGAVGSAGTGGGAGITGGGNGGNGTSGAVGFWGTGGAGDAQAAAGSAGGTGVYAPTGGGSGGGIATTPVALSGGAGGKSMSVAAATAGAANTSGGAGTNPTAYYAGGGGGGGGGSSTAATAGTGGAGARGGGGGGGGAALTITATAAAGGAGGGGYCAVVTSF